MGKQAYIKANGRHIDDDSMAALEQIPADKWATVIAAAEAIDAAEIGLDCTVAVTRETLDDFANSHKNHWSEQGKTTTAILDGRAWRNVQIAKGQRRVSLAVVDCGDFRVCLTAA